MAVGLGKPKNREETLDYGSKRKREDGIEDDDELTPLLSRKETRPQLLWSVRLFTSIMGFFGLTASFAGRSNMSVALTAMANSSYSTSYSTYNTTAEICPARNNNTNTTFKEGEFPWDAHTQEQILAAFYYSFAAFGLPFGYLVDAYPRISTWVIGLGYGLSAVCSLFVPLAAYSRSVGTLLAVRIIAGFSESGSYPAMYSLMARWAPASDRGTLLAIVFSGSSIGQIFAPVVSGYISETDFLGGWPATFYIIGSFGVIWAIFWLLLVYDSPLSHPRISHEEREYIATQLKLRKKKRRGYPWLSIFTSVRVYAVATAEFGVMWLFYSLQTNLPIYLKEALRFDISQVGILTAIPQICLFFFIMGGGFLADFLVSLNRISISTIRKIMSTIGVVPSGLLMIAAGYAGCNAPLAISCVSLGLAFTGCSYSGPSLSMMEFAPTYAGICVAIANTAAVMTGFVGPLVASALIENQADITGWRNFFWVSFGVVIVPWIIFVTFGTSDIQDWAKPVVEDKNDDPGDVDTLKSDVGTVDDNFIFANEIVGTGPGNAEIENDGHENGGLHGSTDC